MPPVILVVDEDDAVPGALALRGAVQRGVGDVRTAHAPILSAERRTFVALLLLLTTWAALAAPGDVRRRQDQLISLFENSTPELQYAYAERLDDGRGVTSGRAGFTTATGDALDVVERYTRLSPHNPLARFLPELRRLAHRGSADTTGLPERDYMEAWKQAARDPRFRQVQDDVVDQTYYTPAMKMADTLGLKTALARGELYDTAIQHGTGDDPDGLRALVERTTHRVGTPQQIGEKQWLDAYFNTRIADLTHPANHATTTEWRGSIDRVECFRRIARTGNYDLHGPLHVTVFGDAFTLP